MIRLAEIPDLESVLQITHDTISEIYSHYYAEGVVGFFLGHHSREHILSDIKNGIVWLLEEDGNVIGTVTIKGNAVNRLFVLPEWQSHGYGSQLMDFAEDKIAEQFTLVHIDSSLAAKEMYLKRGYKERKTCRIQADNGDVLIYDEMEKQLAKQWGRINYNGKIFIPRSNMEWNSTLYDKKHDFVAEYGKALLEFIPQNAKQTILDLGCGTGTLTAQLAELCNKVVGVDASQSMIDKAKEEFGNIEFKVCDALVLPFENEFDIIFSNAVFHWISDHDALLKNIHKALKPQGILVCEFGASGNIATIENAFLEVCSSRGYSYESKFNFPTVEVFDKLLEKNGYIIDRIYDYDRPTVLKDGEQGLVNWLKQFFVAELEMMPEHEQVMVFEKVEELTREDLWNGTEWVADYRRLRAVAHI